MKCPFCGSEELLPLPSANFIRKKYRKNIPGMVTGVDEGEYIYPIIKGICLECGYVFEKMKDEDLKKYHEEKQYFIN